MFNKSKIETLQYNIEYLYKELKKNQSSIDDLNNEVSKLKFISDNPLKYKVGDTPFKDIIITKIECKSRTIWYWRITAFDTKNKKKIFLDLDCCNNLKKPY